MHWSLGHGAQLLFRRKWRKFDTLLFFFTLLVHIVCIVKWNEIFCSMGQVFEWIFLVLHVFWKVCNWDPKLNWPRKCWLWSFSVRLCLVFLSCYLHEQKFARFAQLWFSFNDMNYLRWLVWEVFWSVLYLCPYFLTIGVSNNNWWASSTQSNLFPMFFPLQAFNCQSSDESILWLPLKIIYSFFIVFFFIFKSLSTFYSVSRKSCFLKYSKEPNNSVSRWCPSWCQKRNFGLLRLGKTWTFSDA